MLSAAEPKVAVGKHLYRANDSVLLLSSVVHTPELAATFSNYGGKTVNVFAPGVAIYFSTPGNHYATFSGTSMAAPVAAGEAAVLKTYFPQLMAMQLKQLIMQLAVPYHTRVQQPGG